jgi:hypothetical protein
VEWVCEQGAQEIEDQLAKAQDEDYVDNEEAEELHDE